MYRRAMERLPQKAAYFTPPQMLRYLMQVEGMSAREIADRFEGLCDCWKKIYQWKDETARMDPDLEPQLSTIFLRHFRPGPPSRTRWEDAIAAENVEKTKATVLKLFEQGIPLSTSEVDARLVKHMALTCCYPLPLLRRLVLDGKLVRVGRGMWLLPVPTKRKPVLPDPACVVERKNPAAAKPKESPPPKRNVETPVAEEEYRDIVVSLLGNTKMTIPEIVTALGGKVTERTVYRWRSGTHVPHAYSRAEIDKLVSKTVAKPLVRAAKPEATPDLLGQFLYNALTTSENTRWSEGALLKMVQKQKTLSHTSIKSMSIVLSSLGWKRMGATRTGNAVWVWPDDVVKEKNKEVTKSLRWNVEVEMAVSTKMALTGKNFNSLVTELCSSWAKEETDAT